MRVAHILGVAALGRELAARIGASPQVAADIGQVTLAHDIGYAEALRRTGFHPLDGAIFLAHRRAPEEIIHAVLHHSGAREGAKELPVIAEYYARLPGYQPAFLSDAITWCDVQTGPDGRRMTIAERVQDVVDRYGPDSPTSHAMLRSQPEFEEIYLRVGTLYHSSTKQA